MRGHWVIATSSAIHAMVAAVLHLTLVRPPHWALLQLAPIIAPPPLEVTWVALHAEAPEPVQRPRPLPSATATQRAGLRALPPQPGRTAQGQRDSAPPRIAVERAREVATRHTEPPPLAAVSALTPPAAGNQLGMRQADALRPRLTPPLFPLAPTAGAVPAIAVPGTRTPDATEIADGSASRGAAEPTVTALQPMAAPIRQERGPAFEVQANGERRSDRGTFVANISRDGRLQFRDKPNVHITFALPTVRGIGNAIAQWANDPYATVRAANVYPPHVQPRATPVNDEDPKPQSGGTVPLVGGGLGFRGGFDVTDGVMRATGRDPYAAAKRQLARETRALRDALRAEYDEKAAAQASDAMRTRIAQLWRQPMSWVAKRAAIFALWDEQLEAFASNAGAPLAADQIRDLTAAQAARVAIERYIRAHAPANDPVRGYTDQELTELNAKRRSRAAFAPYRDAVKPPPSARP